ncbi:CU044_2847 family protein [Actinomadura rupiterrae]|uniref:CU044_2847 family protein n=1 Tax=Actinomadura rupiterrae TaxID=559627 RepID=UPI0020A4783E|nr:CU044_2847 family protein [Actinomadura rupiterrae]MCP2341389.1 hypothetical protein [Actinomadura rupiterrae]
MDVQPSVAPEILVEFGSGPGLQQVALSPAEAAQRSAAAIEHSMGVIRAMAAQVADTVAAIPRAPSNVEVSFGIKFDVHAHAVIAKSGLESSLNVKLTWQRDSLEQQPR